MSSTWLDSGRSPADERISSPPKVTSAPGNSHHLRIDSILIGRKEEEHRATKVLLYSPSGRRENYRNRPDLVLSGAFAIAFFVILVALLSQIEYQRWFPRDVKNSALEAFLFSNPVELQEIEAVLSLLNYCNIEIPPTSMGLVETLILSEIAQGRRDLNSILGQLLKISELDFSHCFSSEITAVLVALSGEGNQELANRERIAELLGNRPRISITAGFDGVTSNSLYTQLAEYFISETKRLAISADYDLFLELVAGINYLNPNNLLETSHGEHISAGLVLYLPQLSECQIEDHNERS